MQNSKSKQAPVLVACATLIVFSAGCRSAMPKWSLFSFGKRPSPELLAGEGPTTTYPAPPSASSTPSPISSVAGGVTAPPSATPSITPGLPSSQPTMPGMGLANSGRGTQANLAAAQANGYPFANASTKTPTVPSTLPGYTTPSAQPSNLTVPAIPTGYQFGTRSTPPTPSFAATGPSAAPAKPMASTTPTNGLMVPPVTTPSTTTTASSGFALPAGLAEKVGTPAPSNYEVASNPKPFTPKTPALPSTIPTTPSAELPPAPTSTTPSISTASATLDPSNQSPPVLNSGYAPGSTSGSSSYPGGYPSTGNSGTYYR